MSDLPKPNRRRKATVSKVWYLPIVTALVGLSMLLYSYQNRGTAIEVSFNDAEGIEPGKTLVKYKNVPVGLVKKVGLSDHAKSVYLSIEIEKGMERFLAADSKFWVVKPRVTSSGVSGIGTLLSGSYVAIAPGDSARDATTFVGLESPPISRSDDNGIRLTLIADGEKPLNVGSTVRYKGFSVGAIESFQFDADKREAVYTIFVKAPYDALVTSNTQFWNVSGVSVGASASGFKLEMSSLETVVTGGVQFGVPEGSPLGERVIDGESFVLYNSLSDLENKRHYASTEYVIFIEGSISGLSKGAPVEYRGIRIGTVATPYMNYSLAQKIRSEGGHKNTGDIPVVLKLEPERIFGTIPMAEFDKRFKSWVRGGLTASLSSANLLTGGKKISLDLTKKRRKSVKSFGPYPVIPFQGGGLDQLQGQLSSVLSKIERLPIENTLAELNQAIKGLQPNSTLYQKIEGSMAEIQSTMKDLQPLLRTLQSRPNSLIFGDASVSDVEPRAKPKANRNKLEGRTSSTN